MEYLLPSEIARLVYGYLEGEKCLEAANVFLATSEHLKECYQVSLRNGKFSTKVEGYSLLKCLDQFCAVYRLVQDRIATVQASNICSYELVDQVAYLLDVGCKGHSTVMFNITVPVQDDVNRTIDESRTCANETAETNEADKSVVSTPMSESSDSVSYSVSMEGSPSKPTWCVTNTTPPPSTQSSPVVNKGTLPTLETTSLDSLPGTEKPQKKPKSRRKEPLPVPKVIERAIQDEKLHKRIADNINKVMMTPDKERERERDTGGGGLGGDELESVIKTIVSQTQKDPYFENFMGEFFRGIGNSEGVTDTNSEEESNSSKKKDSDNEKKATQNNQKRTRIKKTKGKTLREDGVSIGTSKNIVEESTACESDHNAGECSNNLGVEQISQTLSRKVVSSGEARRREAANKTQTRTRHNIPDFTKSSGSSSSIIVLPPAVPVSKFVSKAVTAYPQPVKTFYPPITSAGSSVPSLPWRDRCGDVSRIITAKDSQQLPKHGIFPKDFKPGIMLSTGLPSARSFINIAPKEMMPTSPKKFTENDNLGSGLIKWRSRPPRKKRTKSDLTDDESVRKKQKTDSSSDGSGHQKATSSSTIAESFGTLVKAAVSDSPLRPMEIEGKPTDNPEPPDLPPLSVINVERVSADGSTQDMPENSNSQIKECRKSLCDDLEKDISVSSPSQIEKDTSQVTTVAKTSECVSKTDGSEENDLKNVTTDVGVSQVIPSALDSESQPNFSLVSHVSSVSEDVVRSPQMGENISESSQVVSTDITSVELVPESHSFEIANCDGNNQENLSDSDAGITIYAGVDSADEAKIDEKVAMKTSNDDSLPNIVFLDPCSSREISASISVDETNLSKSENKINSDFKKLVSPVNQNRTKKLSLSTPRDKRNHVRVLDFSTPPSHRDKFLRAAFTSPKLVFKGDNYIEQRFRSVCRSHLFESPSMKKQLSKFSPIAEKSETSTSVQLEEPQVEIIKNNLAAKLESDHSRVENMEVEFVDCGKAPQVSENEDEEHQMSVSDSPNGSHRAKSKKPKNKCANGRNITTVSVTKSNYTKIVKKVTRKTVKSQKIGPIPKHRSPKSKAKKSPRPVKSLSLQNDSDGGSNYESSLPKKISSNIGGQGKLELKFKNGNVLTISKIVSKQSGDYTVGSTSGRKTSKSLKKSGGRSKGKSVNNQHPNVSENGKDLAHCSTRVECQVQNRNKKMSILETALRDGSKISYDTLPLNLTTKASNSLSLQEGIVTENLSEVTKKSSSKNRTQNLSKNICGSSVGTNEGIDQFEENKIEKSGISCVVTNFNESHVSKTAEVSFPNIIPSGLVVSEYAENVENQNESSVNDEKSFHFLKDPDENMISLSESCSSENNLFIVTMEEGEENISINDLNKIDKCASIESKLEVEKVVTKDEDASESKGCGIGKSLGSVETSVVQEVKGSSNQAFVCFIHEENEKLQRKFNLSDFEPNEKFLRNFVCELEIEQEENNAVSLCRIAVSEEKTLLSIPSKLEQHSNAFDHPKIVKKKVYHHYKNDRTKLLPSKEILKNVSLKNSPFSVAGSNSDSSSRMKQDLDNSLHKTSDQLVVVKDVKPHNNFDNKSSSFSRQDRPDMGSLGLTISRSSHRENSYSFKSSKSRSSSKYGELDENQPYRSERRNEVSSLQRLPSTDSFRPRKSKSPSVRRKSSSYCHRSRSKDSEKYTRSSPANYRKNSSRNRNSYDRDYQGIYTDQLDRKRRSQSRKSQSQIGVLKQSSNRIGLNNRYKEFEGSLMVNGARVNNAANSFRPAKNEISKGPRRSRSSDIEDGEISDSGESCDFEDKHGKVTTQTPKKIT